MRLYYIKTIITIVFVFFLNIPQAFAGFSLSGSIITQTGTDTNLSGLASIFGVTTYQESNRTIYNIGARSLNISGNLTSDARVEGIVSTNSDLALRLTGGTLTINDFYDDNGTIDYLEDKWFAANIPSTVVSSRFYINAGSTLNMNGGWIQMRDVATPESLQNTININIAYGIFGSYESVLGSGYAQFRTYTQNLNVSGVMRLIKMAYIPRAALNNSINELQSFYPGVAAIAPSGSAPSTELPFPNFSLRGNTEAISTLWSSKKLAFTNAELGSDYTAVYNVPGNGGSTGTVIFRKEVQAKLTDTNGAAINGAIVYAKGTNNGGITNGNGYTFSNLETYTQTTNSSGETSAFPILLGAVNEPSYDGSIGYMYFGKNNNATDLFDFYFWSYNHLPSQSEQQLKGLNVRQIDWTLFGDTNITESNKTTVDAYASIDNLNQLYDRAKSWKVTSANIEYPTIGTQPVIASSTALDLGTISLVIDDTAASAFAINTSTNTITIKTSTLIGGTKFTSIETIGTVSTLNGGTLEFGYIDSSGTNKFVSLEWPANLSPLNVSVVNLDNNTEILGPTSATTTFKSHFLMPNPVPTNGIEVRITNANGTILYQETIPEEDLNFIDLNVILNNASTEENQAKMLRISERLLTKVEAINNSLTGTTTPSITVNETVTNSLDAGTLENQEAILNLLRRLLNKVSANREAFKEN